MTAALHVLDVVALTADFPQGGLARGQVGTIVEALSPNIYEVEFSDDNGRTYARAALRDSELIVLRYEPVRAA
ncbi:MAG: DUF4926 domain-containing protein [Alphaproteobacteria bacterium]|nr:DUF4926 domain-containing protein [Alphaproteobacteria bacterium]